MRFCMTQAQNSRPDDHGETRTGRSACATKTLSESTFLQDEVESPGPAGTRGTNHPSRRVNPVGQEFADVQLQVESILFANSQIDGSPWRYSPVDV